MRSRGGWGSRLVTAGPGRGHVLLTPQQLAAGGGRPGIHARGRSSWSAALESEQRKSFPEAHCGPTQLLKENVRVGWP